MALIDKSKEHNLPVNILCLENNKFTGVRVTNISNHFITVTSDNGVIFDIGLATIIKVTIPN